MIKWYESTKRICLILIFIVLLASGFTYNSTLPMANISYTINGNRVTSDVYFSPDTSGKLFYDELNGELFNVTSSTVYGYVQGQNNISFRSYQTPSQQLGNYTSYDLSNIVVNSVQNYKWYSKTSNLGVAEYSLIVIMLLLGINFITSK